MSDNKHIDPSFYICPICGNIIEMIYDSGQPLMCCGTEMEKMEPNTSDGMTEKHVPVCEVHGHKVTVEIGSEPHPMTPTHHIAWAELVTDRGIQRRCIYPKGDPTICFPLSKHETPQVVYSYCNLHGLWRSEDL